MHTRSFIGCAAGTLLFSLVLLGCGSNQNGDPAAGADGGLSAAQLEKGIGPITSVTLGPVSEELAEKGESIFVTKCSACHKLDSRYVGPPLGDVLSQRAPEYVMNMMLNPAEMIEKHPEAKALFAQFLTPMPNQNLTEEDARAVLEYFRHAKQEDAASSEES